MVLRYDTKSTNNKRKDKLDFTKLRSVCASVDIIKKVKRNPQNGVRTSVNHVSDKESVSRTHENSYNSKTKR